MKLDTISSECELLRTKFERVVPIIIEQLRIEDIWIVEENSLKTFFNIDCDTNSMYDKIRYILKGTDLQIKIEKNKIINGRYTNLFEFYMKDEIEKVRERNNKINEKLIEIDNERKERMSYMVYEDVTKVENKNRESIKDIPTDIPLPYTSICLNCKKKVIIKYPELNCPNCENLILKNWD